MRRLYSITSFITMLPLLLSGCHQNPATSGAPPLSPVGAGQAPTLNPFGGPTKVTPPPTGSYSSPNSYMGSPVPAGTVPPGQISPMSGVGFPAQSNNAVGSGVQPPGGWTSSDAFATQTAPNYSGVATVSTFGVEAAHNDPRAGGMQVIDLTNAPPPPGYRPENSTMSVSVPPPQAPPNGWGPTIQATPTATYPPPTYPAPGYPQPSYPQPSYPATTNPAPNYPASAYPNTNLQNVASPYPSDRSTEIASRLTPLPQSYNAVPINQPAVQSAGPQAPGPIPGPSTEPVNSAGSSNQNLMWRTPGTQF